MKQILFAINMAAVLMLTGCTVSSGMLGNTMAGIGGDGGSKAAGSLSSASNLNGTISAASGAPLSTGAIVPLREEGAVVDLPDASAQRQAQVSSSYQNGAQHPPYGEGETEETQTTDPDNLTPDELHRRELINRGDLPEGAPLPAE